LATSKAETPKSKKRKMSSTEGDDSDDMGDDENKVKDSLRKFAEDNDISPEDLKLAYGASGLKKVGASAAAAAAAAAAEGKTSLGKYLGIDCEMVACYGRHPADTINEISVLARVSIVNYHGHPILDIHVLPPAPVTDWRTHVSGIRPSDMDNAIPFALAQAQVAALLKNRILVGHALKNDLDVLMLSHPKRDVRDTSKHERFRTEFAKGRTPGLKVLAKELLGVEIQRGEHSSVEDARVSMAIYRRYKREFEEEWARRFPGAVRGTVGGPARGVREEGGAEGGGAGEGAEGKKKKSSKPKSKKKKKKTKKR
ncbi:ribonuclease H-like domain-containing protein, partial [Peziza echinospora]